MSDSKTDTDISDVKIFILNPDATKQQIEERVYLHTMIVKSLVDILPEEPLTHVEPTSLIYYFCIIERLVCELQDMLVEVQ